MFIFSKQKFVDIASLFCSQRLMPFFKNQIAIKIKQQENESENYKNYLYENSEL